MKKFWLLFMVLVAGALFLGGMVTQRYYGLSVLVKWINPPDRAIVKPPPTEAIRPNHRGKLSIFILAGQSNMEGDGKMEDYMPIDTDGRAYVFNENYVWVEGQEPVRDRVGPSISFAKQLIDQDENMEVGLINVALGGTSILQWQKSLDDHSLFQTMIKRALAASTQGEIKGLLFFQGETEALGYSPHHEEWDVYFKQFVQDVRQELNLENLPVVFARVIPREDLFWPNVRARQEKVVMENVVMVSTDGIGHLQPDNLHFTAPGYVELGKRLGAAFVQHFMAGTSEARQWQAIGRPDR